MKNKQKTQTWHERLHLLLRLHHNAKWLIVCDKPKKQKLAIWYKDFEKFSKELARQDKILRN
jgi:hypothetical protein